MKPLARSILCAVAAFALAQGAHAAQTPRPGLLDPRIRSVFYNPDQVVQLKGYFGFQMMIEFAPDERIENVSIGDGVAWQVTPNKRANLLFLKPVDRAAPTNMTVVTDRRRYAFELVSQAKGASHAPDMAYVVRFTYPPEPLPPPPEKPLPPAPPERKNTHYTYTGSRTSLPSLVFDDGRFTYFQWPQTTPTPAVFAVAGEGGEALVNFGVRDGYLVVEQVAPKFVLRNGQEVTTVLNDGWREPKPGPDAPRPHTAKSSAAPRGGDR